MATAASTVLAAGLRSARSARAPAPAQVGRFRAIQVLGRGSRGVAYLAEDPALGRRVAVKILRPHVPGAGARPGAVDAVTGLRHPGIVPVYDIGEDRGAPYLVYEYVAGRTLRDRLRGAGRLPAAEAIGHALGILDALVCAHARGVAHLDLKPANVRLDDRGAVRVMDFGLSALDGAIAAPRRGPAGIASYLAPEQLSGAPVGPATDLFSLGLILYEMLTGTRAVGAIDSVSATVQLAHLAIAPPSRRRPGLDPRLERIVTTALQNDPDLRFTSATGMRAALEELGRAAGIDATAGPRGASVSVLPGRAAARNRAAARHDGPPPAFLLRRG